MKSYVIDISRKFEVRHVVQAKNEKQARKIAEEWAYGEFEWGEVANYANVVIDTVEQRPQHETDNVY